MNLEDFTGNGPVHYVRLFFTLAMLDIVLNAKMTSSIIVDIRRGVEKQLDASRHCLVLHRLTFTSFTVGLERDSVWQTEVEHSCSECTPNLGAFGDITRDSYSVHVLR